MTRISKKKLKSSVSEAIGAQLLGSIIHARTKRDAHALLTELLTSSERIMLAKRFAIIAMLARGYSFTQIEKLLETSSDTVVRISRDVRIGKYPALVQYAKNNPKKIEGESFLSLLEKLLAAGMPPRGKGRWAAFKRGALKGTYANPSNYPD